jgi:hypothetical protein
MMWYWRLAMAVVSFNVAFVMAALLRSVIRDRIKTHASKSMEQHYLAQEFARHFLRRPWPGFAPCREPGGQRLTST